MNIIEGLWSWMKDEVINNAFFSNVQEIRQAGEAGIGFAVVADEIKKLSDNTKTNKSSYGVLDSRC